MEIMHFSGMIYALCPRLYLLSTTSNASVASHGFWDGWSWKWSFTWRRELRPQDILEHETLLQAIQQTSISPLDSDHLIWTPHKVEFSVKSFVLELAKSESQPSFDVIKGLWRGLVPHRIEMFTWLALLGKLHTKEKLANIIPQQENTCVLCGLHPESTNHLFIHCTFSWKAWALWTNIWDLKWSTPPTIRAAYDQWVSPLSGAHFKKVWASSFFVIIWTIWKERNARCFENKSNSPNQLHDLVLLRLS